MLKMQQFINKIFSDIAPQYDLMNDIMSCGLHRIWKKKFVQNIKNPSLKIIDVACGSGDIIVEIANKAHKQGLLCDIYGVDANQEMLKIANNKIIDNNILNGVNLTLASAENLPFAHNTFDYYTISFGIRNVGDIIATLNESYRILKPGGKFLCLEFSKITNSYIDVIYNYYLTTCIPFLGTIVANNQEAYQYLSDSIIAFPDPITLRNMITESGFCEVGFETIHGGICAMHFGMKPYHP